MTTRRAGWAWMVVVVVCGGGKAQEWIPFSYHEVGSTRGLEEFHNHPGMSFGVAAADIDDDGDIDLFVPTRGLDPNQLYINEGSGRFVERAAQAGLASTRGDRCALWLDLDGDRDLDLVVGNDLDDAPTSLHLYRQDPGLTFVDITAGSGLDVATQNVHRGGMASGDIDQDGDLDLYVATWGGDGESYLYVNQGDGTFVDETVSSGLRAAGRILQWQPMMHDFDGDGWTDLMVAVDVEENHLFLNQRNGTFVDVGASVGLGNLMNDMGLTLGDFDFDGDFDVFFTNIHEYLGGEHNVFYRNDSNAQGLAFTEISEELGLRDAGWGWGTAFFDADADGDLDLAATNGWHGAWSDDPTRLWLHDGEGPAWYSADVAPDVGLDDTAWGSALIPFDMERDGDLDVLIATKDGLRLMECVARPDERGRAGGQPLVIAPRMDGPNSRAIGAVVQADVGGVGLVRLIHAGCSLQAQEPAEAWFGLGAATVADQVTVRFPGGAISRLTNVPFGAEPLEVSPPPFTHARVLQGARRRGRLHDLTESDDQRWVVARRGAGMLEMEAGWNVPITSTRADVEVESAVSVARADVTLELLDHTQQTWTQVAAGTVGTTDAQVAAQDVLLTPFVDEDGIIHMRVRWSLDPAVPGTAGWRARVDQVGLVARD